ncbi:MAG: hypothetical protein K1X61_03190 [Chitinophagales bacterium]|nr:hypothetical protein [Chitinophagales bacterium]
MTTILLLLTFVSFGQSAKSITEMFKRDSLPICVSYSHDEQVYFGAIYHTDTIEGEAQDVFEKNASYQKDSSLLLTKEFVMQHLFPKSKYSCTLGGKNNDTPAKASIEDFLNSDFYAISSPLTTKSYYVVLYERVFAINGIPGSEKYICTLDKNGKYISQVLIASFVFSGTGLSISGARVPWFTDENGCINKDLTIKFASQVHGEKRYKIQADGKIVETE